MEQIIVKLTKWLLSKFAPNYHVHKNARSPRRIAAEAIIREMYANGRIKNA